MRKQKRPGYFRGKVVLVIAYFRVDITGVVGGLVWGSFCGGWLCVYVCLGLVRCRGSVEAKLEGG